MRTRLILITIICLSFGKAYSGGILDENNLWKYQILNFSIPPPYQRNYISFVKIGNDTVIDFTTYKKVSQMMDSRYVKWETTGCIRETGHKVFFKPLHGNEKLLFDFAPKVNDSLNIYSFSCVPEIQYKVLKVDSIRIGGKYEKKINLISNPYNLKETWIEGIGDSLSGFFHGQHCLGGDTHRLECFFQNNELQFSNNQIIQSGYLLEEVQCDCVYPNFNTGINKLVPEEITVFPNPTKDKIRLSNSGKYSSLRIELLDINGKILGSYLCSKESIEVDITNLKSGIYILVLTNNENIRKFKVIKE